MNAVLNVMIVDDEPLAHQVLLHHLATEADVQVLAKCFSAAEALAFLAHQQVDLLLLDISMPVLTGLDMLKVMAQRPQVVITTAFAEHALEGFVLEVTDYLLKPISAERLRQALNRVRHLKQLRETRALDSNPVIFLSSAEPDSMRSDQPTNIEFIVLKVDRELRRFELTSICCFEAYGNYVKVWQGEQMTLATTTLKRLLSRLPAGAFVQVHKSYVVSSVQIISRDHHSLRLSNRMIVKIGEAYKKQASVVLLCLGDASLLDPK